MNSSPLPAQNRDVRSVTARLASPMKLSPSGRKSIQGSMQVSMRVTPISMTESSPLLVSKKKDLIVTALAVASHDEISSTNSKNFEEGEESVHSIERIMCPRAASFGQSNKKRGGRWDTNLMEDSMPGLVSFCHGSFASELNGSSANGDDGSVSSLECSLMNSEHSSKQVHRNSVDEERNSPNETAEDCNVLQPLTRTIESDSERQEVRWSGGALHRSSDTLPSVVRRSI